MVLHIQLLLIQDTTETAIEIAEIIRPDGLVVKKIGE